MKTRIPFFLLGVGLLAGSAKAQPPRIVLHGVATPQVYAADQILSQTPKYS